MAGSDFCPKNRLPLDLSQLFSDAPPPSPPFPVFSAILFLALSLIFPS